MADDVTYTSTGPGGVPDGTKQVTDEHATRGHMPLFKIAYSADGDATPVTVDANGVKVNASGVAVPVTDNASTLSVDDGAGSLTVDALAASTHVDIGLINAVTPLMGAGVTGTGSLRTTKATGATGTRTTSTTTVDAQILASTATRIRYTVFNEADKDFLLGEGTAAVTTSDFTARIKPGESWSSDDFSGQVRGLFTAALGSGRLQITEIT